MREAAWSPDGQHIVFTADRDGDEFKQLYVIPAKGGRPEPLTDAPRVRHALAYAGNDREPTDQDVLIRKMGGAEVGRPMSGGGLYYPATWSPDGSMLTIIEANSNTDFDIHLLTVGKDEHTLLTPPTEETIYEAGPWAADGSGFWLLSDEGREFLGLAFWDLNDGMRWVETPEATIEDVVASADGRYLAWAVNDEGYSQLHVRDLVRDELLPLPELPRGVIDAMALSPSGGKLAMLLDQSTHPAEVYVVDLERGELTRLTDSFLGGIEDADFIAPELIRYPTHDDREIPAWLYKPAGDGPFPVVLSIHGGPEAQERPYYAYGGLYQYLLSRGIGILAPNVRGSFGYGKSYQKLIHHDWGGDELGDFKAAAEYMKGLDWVDADRIGVFGGSFGGFATLSCVSRLPEYWAVAVDWVGPSNLVTFANAVPPTWRRFMAKWVGDPETEVDFLMERSPITYVDQITAPLFVIQGANDPRVVKGESDQIVERLRERGVEVRYDVYEDEDEGHGFIRRENELTAMGDTARFFEERLA